MKWKVESKFINYKRYTEILVKIYKGGKQRTRRITSNFIEELLKSNKYSSLNDIIINFMILDLRVNPYKIKDFKEEIMRIVRDKLP